MQYPNAYKGVKRIYIAEILTLIATILAIIGAAIMIVRYNGNLEQLQNLQLDAESVDLPIAIASALVLIAGILAIISFIISLVGVCNARIDESAFTGALIMIILSIVVSITGSVMQNTNPTAANWANVAVSVLTLASTLFIIKGIMNLAEKLERPDMVSKGRSIMAAILIINIIAIAASAVSAYLELSETQEKIVEYVSLGASVATLIFLLIYLSYLNKAKKMLQAYGGLLSRF